MKNVLSKIAFIFLPIITGILFILVILFPNNMEFYKVFFDFWWFFGFWILFLIMFSKPIFVINENYWKNSKISIFTKKIIWLRKELWVIMFYLALIHWFLYFIYEYQVGDKMRLLENDIIIWIIALSFLFISAITSNIFSIKTFGKWWKIIQFTAYYWFIFAIAHLGYYISPYILIIWFIYIIFKLIEYYKTPKMWIVYLINYIILLLINIWSFILII